MIGAGPWVTLLAALAGGLAAVAARETALATPAAARWLRLALEPLGRAGREGYSPTEAERRRLRLAGAGVLLGLGLLLFGPMPAALGAAAGPALAGSVLGARRARYRRAVERGMPEVAGAVADALAGGRSLRSALTAAADSLEGAPAAELSRVRADLDLGAPVREALASLRGRAQSARVDSFAAALLSQHLGGGDLAELLRRYGAAAAERDRVAADARSATAQARFTGLLVVAMPTGAALFAELIQPGFMAGLLANPAAAVLLTLAAALQLLGFALIRRLSLVGSP